MAIPDSRPLTCPQCGGQGFHVDRSDGDGLNALIGGTCPGCGYVFNQTDVDKITDHLKELMAAELRDQLKKAGFK